MIQSHLILLGLRGSGKTTVGRLVARELGARFVDLDDRTPLVMGCTSVAQAWTEQAEAAFRAAERTALETVLAEPASVVALGGGTPTAPGAADRLRQAAGERATLVYLRGTPPALADRLRRVNNKNRPSLTGQPANSLEEIQAVFARRDDLYRSLAQVVVEIDELGVQPACRAVLAAVTSA